MLNISDKMFENWNLFSFMIWLGYHFAEYSYWVARVAWVALFGQYFGGFLTFLGG